ncbi:MAG TPA: ACT domain-containing protein [Candidatus Acidoferrum sp.]|nr:ACT domain-containing protein [Candidatus Acidoferrum sp.]
MRAIVTVVAKDAVGIMALVTTYLADHGVNIMDISQTLMQEYFAMIMLVDLATSSIPFDELRRDLLAAGESRGLSITIQREEIFNAMHRI